MSTTEYAWYVDSHNRERKLLPETEDPNPTNDITIPMNFSRSRLPVAQIHLGSLELPLAQYTVEENWKNLYFDEGLDLIVTDPLNYSLVEFSIREGSSGTISALLPPSLNPIINVQNPASTNPIFTTLYPHCLELKNEFNWGESLKLISTTLTDPSIVNLSSSNTSLTIISSTEFQLSLPALPVPPLSPTYPQLWGYVKSPTIPNPTTLASLVTAGLSLVSQNWRVTYDPYTGKFKLKWLGSGCSARNISPATLLIPCDNSLPSIMGFGRIDTNIPLPNPESSLPPTDFQLLTQSRHEVKDVTETCLFSHACYPCKSHISIDPGNYAPNELSGNVTRQFNRFYFDSGCNPPPGVGPDPITFVYSDSCGVCHTITIPFGMYTPDTLAEYIETQMGVNVPNVTVDWDNVTGQFVFQAPGGFGLEFDASTTDLSLRMGFLPICYRNNNLYKSPRPFYVPTKGCCATTIPDRFISHRYMMYPISTQRKFAIQPCKTRCLDAVQVSAGSPGTMILTTGTTTNPTPVGVAHGYQPYDVIDVTVGGVTYPLQVVSTLSYNQVEVNLGSVPLSTFQPGPVCTCLSGSIAVNLYFADDCAAENAILPQILGFLAKDMEWVTDYGDSGLISPSCFNLDWPSYLLFELVDPNGATHNQHNWDGDNKPRIFGKIILYPQYRMERMFPIQMYLPDLRILTRMKFRLLNPNHSLYQLHGREWSCTMVLHAVEKSITQLCY